jgi:hypothetical protein
MDPKALLAFHRSCSQNLRFPHVFLLDAIVTSPIDNAEYAHDVIAVWAFQQCQLHAGAGTPFAFGDTLTEENLTHAARAILSSISTEYVGAVILNHAAKRLNKIPIVMLPRADEISETRLSRLVINAAKDCQFDKRGDSFLWNLLRFALAPHIESGTFNAAPYAAIAKTHGAAANDVVGAWTSTMPTDLPTKIDYTSFAPNNLVVVAGILGEHIDNVDMWVRVNGDMLRGHNDAAPCLAAFHGCGGFSDTTGVFDGATFFATHEETPVTSAVLKWAATVNSDSTTLLFDALTKPPNQHSKLSMMAAVI